MDDDLNTPKGLAALFTFARAANRLLDEGAWSSEQAAGAASLAEPVLAVLDVLPSGPTVSLRGTGRATPGRGVGRATVDAPAEEADAELAGWVAERLAERQAARAARDFARADAIRDELVARGVEVEDTPQGTRWRVRRGFGTGWAEGG